MSETPIAALRRLQTALEALALADRPDFETSRRIVIETIAALHYRSRRREGEPLPFIRLLCGPSGGGKSSFFNALVGKDLSRVSSVERPATRGVLCAISTEAGLDGVMPTLTRVDHGRFPGSDAFSLVEISVPSLGPQLLLDGPDYDSREERNRALVELILPWADEVIFVTSLERYGDRSAAPILSRVDALGIPLVAVLNKIEGEIDAPLREFESRIAELGGPTPRRRVGLLRRDGGIDPATEIMGELRRTPPASEPDRDALLEEVRRRADDALTPALAEWRRDVDALRVDLDGLLSLEDQLHDDGRLRQLEDYEAESKFWLRYSPRGLLRGARELMRDPARIFRSTELPHEPDEEALLELVLEQARRVQESMRIRARETMKRHRPGRLLIAEGGLESLEAESEALADRMRPIAHALHDFGRARMDAFKQEWSKHRHGMLARARFWAIDKVLRLLSLCLTLAVLPPLIWELLRFIGHPAFTNEVTAEFHRARADFRDGMAEVESGNIRQTMAAVEALGPLGTDIDEFRAALRALEETAR